MKKSKRGKTITAVAVIMLLMIAAAVFIALPEIKKEMFPKKFEAEIKASAEEFDIEEELVFAVVKCESSFKKDAKSSAGAIGLMQIMPDTGEWLGDKLGLEIKIDDLYEVQTNVRLGCSYLRFLFDRFEDEKAVIAAYNAGHGRVKQWLDNKEYSADGKTLDNIPFSETKQYVEKVMNAYENYKEIYN